CDAASMSPRSAISPSAAPLQKLLMCDAPVPMGISEIACFDYPVGGFLSIKKVSNPHAALCSTPATQPRFCPNLAGAGHQPARRLVRYDYAAGAGGTLQPGNRRAGGQRPA